MRQNSGISLLEVVIVTGIVAVCSVILSSVFISQNRLYKTETAELNITGDARLALDDIDNYARSATRTVSSYSSYTAGSQVLILQIQSIDSSKRLIASTYDYVVFYLSSGKLYHQIFPDASSSRVAQTKRLARNVNSLTFTYNNASYSSVTQVTTSLTLQENAGAQTRSITVSSTSTLRDY